MCAISDSRERDSASAMRRLRRWRIKATIITVCTASTVSAAAIGHA
jgi:hypothetical protein